MNPHVKTLVLAGGSGMRFWPYSTDRLPKQFLKINGRESSFSQAIERAIAVSGKDGVFISTNRANLPHIRRELRASGFDSGHVLVKERNYETGLSILFGLKEMRERFGLRDDDVAAVLPADHFVEPLSAFRAAIRDAAAVAAKHRVIVALGKTPASPEESFGYMALKKKNVREGFYGVKKFVEKPARRAAEDLIRGGCFWNLGMYIFPVGLIFEEFKDYFGVKDIDDISPAGKTFEAAAAMAFDKMIPERTKHLVAMEAKFDWLDMGSWKAFHQVSGKDENNNVNIGEHILVDTAGSLIAGGEKPIVTVSAENLFVVDHGDALLVVSGGHVDGVKRAIPLIREKHPRLVRGLPFVSVCTVHSGDPRPLEASVESVLAQDYPFTEHLIIDLGHRGGTERMRTRGAKVADRIAAAREAESVYGALNTAVEESTGEILAVLNSGDAYFDEGAIRAMVDAMETTGADVAWGDLIYVRTEDPSQMTRFWQSSPHHAGLFAHGWMPPHPSFLARRSVFEKYGGFRTDMPLSASYEFMLRVLEKEGVKSCYVPRIVVKMRESGGNPFGRIIRIVKANLQSYRSWKVNNLPVEWWFIFAKPLSKLRQSFKKGRSIELE